MYVDASLSGGSIVVIGAPKRASAELLLRGDSAATIKQWFHFRVSDVENERVDLSILNAGEATFVEGFHNYRALASYDLSDWFRVPTYFDGRRLSIRHRPEQDTVYYSYFAAYPEDRHNALVETIDSSPLARLVTVGRTALGNPMDVLILGNEGSSKRRLWIVGRQHPGETMSEWFVEGALQRLIDEDDEIARQLLQEAVVYVVPNANPDGSALGNFRTNAAGRDLNREWANPSPGASPEVLALRSMMEDTGCDLFLDVHGEESAPCSFLVGCLGNPHYSERLYRKERAFAHQLAQKESAFSTEFDYGPDDPGKGDLRIANNWVGERFDCLSVTLEMPFKDIDRAHGFSPDRAQQFGHEAVESLLAMMEELD